MNMRNLILVALFAAGEAGKAILDVYHSDFGVQYKDDKSPLTLADKNSHEIIFHHLRNRSIENDNNGLPFLSEEGRDIVYEERRRWEYFWLVDPLDGTKEFIKRNGDFTVNIALIRKNRPVLGVIYVPVKGIFYFAASGIGSYKLADGWTIDGLKDLVTESGQEKCISGKVDIAESGDDRESLFEATLARSTKLTAGQTSDNRVGRLSIVGSRSHATKELGDFVERMKLIYPEVDLISAGSSLKFCLVAEGSADIYPRFGPTMEWDTAAGQIIVEESGGRVLSIETRNAMTYNKESLLNPWFIVTREDDSNEIW